MTFKDHASLSVEEVFFQFKTSLQGLTEQEAIHRLSINGSNNVADKRLQWERVFLRQFSSPFLYILACAAGLSAFFHEWINAGMIAVFVCVNAGIGFVQEYHSEHAVELLRRFVVAKSRVRRGGKETWIDSRHLVVGDIVILEIGDVIRADVRFIETEGMTVDESVLTGESVPTEKYSETPAQRSNEIILASNIGFAGTTIVTGRGIGVVIATGTRTQIGEIGQLTAQAEGESPFEKGLRQFSRFILYVILLTLVVVVGANILLKGTNVDIPELFIFAIVLAVSVIPEALPVVTTMTLSRGALRLARDKVVAKRLSSVEDLGSIEVLCTDKTGTLTENKMTVADIFGNNPMECLWEAACGSSFLKGQTQRVSNSFDAAVLDRLDSSGCTRLNACERLHEIPFDPAKRWNSVVIKEEGKIRLIVRGAPEEILALCDISGDQKKRALVWEQEQGKIGRRLLAVAVQHLDENGEYAPRPEEGHLTFCGMISYEDPIRPTAREAVEQSKRLGVQVKILTGDSREVAGSVAKQVGLISSFEEVMTGAEWASLPEEDRQVTAEHCAVFARVSPRQKFEIMETLQHHFEVGFLGEGINDAPALKIANVGIVVDTASDIAREAADIILLEHGLGVIVSGMRGGREVFTNTTKYIQATLASNFGNFYAVAVSTFFIPTLPMLPLQILLLNLLSDFPMIAIATDRVEPEELRRPRTYHIREVVMIATVLGFVSALFDFLFFAIFSHASSAVLQTSWFIGSVLTELVLIFSIRTRHVFFRAAAPSRILFILSALAAVVAVMIPFLTFGQKFFSFATPSVRSLIIIFAVVLVYFVVSEIAKLAYYRTIGRQEIHPTALA